MLKASPDAPRQTTTHVALLRAINVGGTKKVAMGDLRDFVAALGFQDVRTVVQTGNLVFRSEARTTADLERKLETNLERKLEAEARKRLDLDTDFFVRSAKEWDALIAQNPFPDEAERDPSHLIVMALKDAPDVTAVKELQAVIEGPETVRSVANQLYVVYPAGIGRSKLTLKLIEGKLGTRGTGRNWNTVLKIAALAAEPA